MKLITTIYIAISFILAMFCIVTIGYVQQTQKVRHNIESVLSTTNIIKEVGSAQRFILDMETGLRGYLLTGQLSFLEPFYQGRQRFNQSFLLLDSMTAPNAAQNKLLHQVREDVARWENTFAKPLIEGKKKVNQHSRNRSYYDSLFNATAQQGVGKQLMDKARNGFRQIRHEEERVRNERVDNTDQSLIRTNEVAIGLTIMAIITGGLTAFILGKTIKKRFRKMNNLAMSIANGKYDVALEDDRKDEISALTQSLNVMALKLQNSFTHLTKMNSELDQFAYVVSHDLKAPLRAINNLAEWISEDMTNEDPEIHKNLTILRGRVQRMENLINGILDYSRIGRKELPLTTFSVQEVLRETLENLAPPPSFKVITPSVLPTITGERTLFYQVLSNLLSNAFKYHHSQEGQVEVRYKELPGFFQFQVHDDGPGIPPEFHTKIFGIFQTMEARDVKESTGVGLSIVKKIIEEKGGRIWVESEKDKGTTFLFTWPKVTTAVPSASNLLRS
ncbi:sensor histidine kinase [Rufibacter radiotolerans]|uniref:sensor histidine kinase n=1 Tax=Rufibacter radiotolerans TaxID=1379910 RepID=UPI00069FF4B5|nr:ATP-binding protein [Rufibacter radiotolerans]